MASFTLDDIRAAAERKYGSTDITVGETTVSLVNPLRLPKVKRTALMALQTRMESEDADQEELLAEAIRLIAESAGKAEILLEAVGDDLSVLAEIFSRYSQETEAGEASASAS